jgi:hypothetical protein
MEPGGGRKTMETALQSEFENVRAALGFAA